MKTPYSVLNGQICKSLLQMLDENHMKIEMLLELQVEDLFSKKAPTIDDILADIEKISESELQIIDTATGAQCEFQNNQQKVIRKQIQAVKNRTFNHSDQHISIFNLSIKDRVKKCSSKTPRHECLTSYELSRILFLADSESYKCSKTKKCLLISAFYLPVLHSHFFM